MSKKKENCAFWSNSMLWFIVSLTVLTYLLYSTYSINSALYEENLKLQADYKDLSGNLVAKDEELTQVQQNLNETRKKLQQTLYEANES